jgi:hypothetical protein
MFWQALKGTLKDLAGFLDLAAFQQRQAVSEPYLAALLETLHHSLIESFKVLKRIQGGLAFKAFCIYF